MTVPCDDFEDFLSPALPLPLPPPPEPPLLLKLAAALAATELPAPKATRVGAANGWKQRVFIG